ncbi:hypothetical protein [Methylobacterium brachythecii]|uniref:Uncharacterized protein n=1 Tax=Methylobacterium brachythecii TaxID=1176177 RepID=A0A7W6F6X6_9HYPH|nr:hypothetical protein [Methylobacterium brachythecii]MBB3902809.1 hypothetical protein [Methylobacterium brachythecii]GLS43734.1 hypothetical protein GCM10007884_17190 [Methylobacterium brachythecii]
MTLFIRRPPERSFDRDGKPIVCVPLANSDAVARIFPKDYERLLAEGRSGNWTLNCGHVKAPDWRTGPKRVARLVAGPKGDVRVRHRDRDPLNLRSDNLEAVPFVRRKATPRAIM